MINPRALPYAAERKRPAGQHGNVADNKRKAGTISPLRDTSNMTSTVRGEGRRKLDEADERPRLEAVSSKPT